jgi:predicted PurR-regulated permease PerM
MEPAPSRPEGDTLSQRALAVFLGVGGVVIALLLGLVIVRLWPIIVLLAISLMLVAALAPIVRRIQDRFNRKVATAVVVTSLLIGILALLVFTVPAVVSQLSTVAEDFDSLFTELRARSSPEVAAILDQIKVAAMPDKVEPHAVREVVFTSFTVVASFVTVVMLTVYLVVEGPSVATALVSVFPRDKRLRVRQMFGEMGEQVGAYLRGQVVTSTLAGVSTYVVLVAFGVPNAFALAWIVALLDAVPIVGAVLGTVPAVVSAYTVGVDTAVYVLVLLVLYNQFESYWLVPRVFGRALNMSSLTVLLSILVGATLLGMVGAFLALPFAAMVPILLRYFHEWRAEGQEAAEAERVTPDP